MKLQNILLLSSLPWIALCANETKSKSSLTTKLSGPFYPKKGKYIGSIEDPTPEYKIEFDMRVFDNSTTAPKNFYSIVTFKANGPYSNTRMYGDRNPGIWCIGGRLHVGQGTTKYPNVIIDGKTIIDTSKDYRVKIEAIGDHVALYIDGKLDGKIYIPLGFRPDTLKRLNIYSGDPSYEALPKAGIRNIVYTRVTKKQLSAPSSLTTKLSGPFYLKKGKYIGSIEDPTPEYKIEFDMRVLDNSTTAPKTFYSIMTFKANGPYSNIKMYGDRNPGIWYIAGRLLVGQGTTKDPNVIIDGKTIIDTSKDYRVKIEAIGDHVALYIDGKLDGKIYIPLFGRPDTLKRLNIYSGDPSYEALPKAGIRNIVYTRITKKRRYVQAPLDKNELKSFKKHLRNAHV